MSRETRSITSQRLEGLPSSGVYIHTEDNAPAPLFQPHPEGLTALEDSRPRRLVWNLKDSACQAGILSVGFLCDDVHIRRGCVAQETVNGRYV